VKGIEAVKANIMAGKTVSRILRSSLGPKGMDKMLQSADGDITISKSRKRSLTALMLSSSLRPQPSHHRLWQPHKRVRQAIHISADYDRRHGCLWQ
jgi:chaperonin GroEL (HSP60 family)